MLKRLIGTAASALLFNMGGIGGNGLNVKYCVLKWT